MDQPDRGTWPAYKSSPLRAQALMSDNKSGPVFFHPASETKDLSGFWGGGRGLVSADPDTERAFEVNTSSCCPRHCRSWTDGRMGGWGVGWMTSPEKRGELHFRAETTAQVPEWLLWRGFQTSRRRLMGHFTPWISRSDLKININAVTQTNHYSPNHDQLRLTRGRRAVFKPSDSNIIVWKYNILLLQKMAIRRPQQSCYSLSILSLQRPVLELK